jgi:hypothetical protein
MCAVTFTHGTLCPTVESTLTQGRTHPGRQVAVSPRKFVVAPCIFDSNYSWFVYDFAGLKFSEFNPAFALVLIFENFKTCDWPQEAK